MAEVIYTLRSGDRNRKKRQQILPAQHQGKVKEREGEGERLRSWQERGGGSVAEGGKVEDIGKKEVAMGGGKE